MSVPDTGATPDRNERHSIDSSLTRFMIATQLFDGLIQLLPEATDAQKNTLRFACHQVPWFLYCLWPNPDEPDPKERLEDFNRRMRERYTGLRKWLDHEAMRFDERKTP